MFLLDNISLVDKKNLTPVNPCTILKDLPRFGGRNLGSHHLQKPCNFSKTQPPYRLITSVIPQKFNIDTKNKQHGQSHHFQGNLYIPIILDIYVRFRGEYYPVIPSGHSPHGIPRIPEPSQHNPRWRWSMRRVVPWSQPRVVQMSWGVLVGFWLVSGFFWLVSGWYPKMDVL